MKNKHSGTWDHEGDRSGRYRGGKTEKDHRTGAHSARFANRAARVEWQHDRRATNATFPGRAK
jgi:hypothetical protein